VISHFLLHFNSEDESTWRGKDRGNFIRYSYNDEKTKGDRIMNEIYILLCTSNIIKLVTSHRTGRRYNVRRTFQWKRRRGVLYLDHESKLTSNDNIVRCASNI